MTAILKYHEVISINDGKIVFRTLSENNIEIVKTTTFLHWFAPQIKIRVDSQKELNNVVKEINSRSEYTVSVIKVSK